MVTRHSAVMVLSSIALNINWMYFVSCSLTQFKYPVSPDKSNPVFSCDWNNYFFIIFLCCASHNLFCFVLCFREYVMFYVVIDIIFPILCFDWHTWFCSILRLIQHFLYCVVIDKICLFLCCDWHNLCCYMFMLTQLILHCVVIDTIYLVLCCDWHN